MTLPNLYHLKYFVDAVELGSMSAAAEKNRVTHPAISRAITALENQWNVALLVHQKKSFQPTSDGLKVAQQAKVLLQASQVFGEGKLSSPEGVIGKVRIGLSRTLAHTYLVPLLERLSKALPQVQVQVSFGATSEIQESLASGSLDIGLTIGTMTMPTLKQTRLGKGNFILVESKQSKRRGPHIEGFILTEPRYETELLKREFLNTFKRSAPIRYEVKSWDMIADLAAENLGVGLIPEIALTKKRKTVLRTVKTDWFGCDYELMLQEKKAGSTSFIHRTTVEIFKDCLGIKS